MHRKAAYAVIAAGLLAAGPLGAEVAPQDVVYGEDGTVAESLTGMPGDAESGKQIVADKSAGNCVACHMFSSLPDVDFQGNIGPSLDGAGDRWDEAQLRGIVADAKRTFPESMMPSQYKVSGYVRPGDAFTGKAGTEPLPPLLNGQQIEDVVAYLMTLKE